jgi:hypothetical protein
MEEIKAIFLKIFAPGAKNFSYAPALDTIQYICVSSADAVQTVYIRRGA